VASDKKICAYVKCNLGDDGGKKEFYATKRGKYCCEKHGQYQRRLDKKDQSND
jgi:hypothetical protein